MRVAESCPLPIYRQGIRAAAASCTIGFSSARAARDRAKARAKGTSRSFTIFLAEYQAVAGLSRGNVSSASSQTTSAEEEHSPRDQPEGGFERAAVARHEPKQQGADAVAEVAPEAVDADGRAAPVGVGDVGHGGGQIGIEQGHAQATKRGSRGQPAFSRKQWHQPHATAAQQHAPHDGLQAPDAVRQAPGEELGDAPDQPVTAHDPADVGQRHAALVEPHRVDDPHPGIDEFLHQPGLAQRGQALVAPRHEGEHFPGRGLGRDVFRIARPGTGAGRMLGRFQTCPGQGLLHPQQGGQSGRAHRSQAEQQQAQACAQLLGKIRSDDARHRHAHVTGELVDADGEAALVAARKIQLRGLGHRPGEALIDAEEDGGSHDPVPGRSMPDHQRNRQRRDPAPEQHGPAPQAFRQAARDEIERALDYAEGDHKTGQQQERALGHAEFGFGQRRHHGAHHAKGEADEEHLDHLVGELGDVVTDAVVEVVRRTCHAESILSGSRAARSSRRASLATPQAECRNRAQMKAPTIKSGQGEAVCHTAAAASRTAVLA